MYNAKGSCTRGLTTPKIIAQANGITLGKWQASKERGKLRIARILILDEYSAFLTRSGFDTVVLHDQADQLCLDILERPWFKATGNWNQSKLIAALSRSKWQAFLGEIPYVVEGDGLAFNAHQHPLRKVLRLTKREYTVLSPIGEYQNE